MGMLVPDASEPTIWTLMASTDGMENADEGAGVFVFQWIAVRWRHGGRHRRRVGAASCWYGMTLTAAARPRLSSRTHNRPGGEAGDRGIRAALPTIPKVIGGELRLSLSCSSVSQ